MSPSPAFPRCLLLVASAHLASCTGIVEHRCGSYASTTGLEVSWDTADDWISLDRDDLYEPCGPQGTSASFDPPVIFFAPTHRKTDVSLAFSAFLQDIEFDPAEIVEGAVLENPYGEVVYEGTWISYLTGGTVEVLEAREPPPCDGDGLRYYRLRWDLTWDGDAGLHTFEGTDWVHFQGAACEGGGT